jgi:uncharacterized integral membrane protein
MLALLVIILFGILIAVFATQNTGFVDISFANYQLTGIPLYFVALIGLLMGVLISWILSFFDAVSSFFTMHGKDSKINDQSRSITGMKQKIHSLEIENARLRGEKDATKSRVGILGKSS